MNAWRPLLAACLLCTTWAAAAPLQRLTDVRGDMAIAFACEVDRRLDVPEPDQLAYAERLRAALAAAGVVAAELPPQHLLLIDRNRRVEVAFLYRVAPSGAIWYTGASPVFIADRRTPLGVFAKGIDARLPAQALGEPFLRERGIEAPESFERFLVRHGVLDAAFEAVASPRPDFQQTPRAREMTRWPGRYLVVVDSAAGDRPPWAGRESTAPPPPECSVKP